MYSVFSQFLNKVSLLLVLVLSSLLVACGGGSSSTATNVNQNPTQISPTNWAESKTLQALSNNSNLTVDDLGDRLKIIITYPDFLTASNTQVYIDSDNNIQTGFSYTNQAWKETGADYLIENQTIYKSTSNSSDWAWSSNTPSLISSVKTTNVLEIVVDKEALGDPCTTIKIGLIGLSDSWGVEVMYPLANSLQEISIQSCGGTVIDTTKPFIGLHGSNSMDIVKGNIYREPGAIANDNVDGNISNNISIIGTVNTDEVGAYTLEYRVEDSAGNVANKYRVVNVINAPTSNGITVDGSRLDWDGLSASAYEKLIDLADKQLFTTSDAQKKNVFLLMQWDQLIDSDNIQYYLDTDNNVSTGYQRWDSSLGRVVSGAEYLIENGSLTKYTGTNGYDWSWEYISPNPVEYVYNNQVAELKFPISLVTADQVGVTAYRLDSSWSNSHLLAENQSITVSTTGPVKKFTHIKMHSDLLKSQSLIWGERGSYSTTVQSLNLLSRTEEGSTSLEIESTDDLYVNQLLVYQNNSDNYYVAQIKAITVNRPKKDLTIELVEPLKASVESGQNLWNFYSDSSHPNQYGYRAIADFMVANSDLDATSQGIHVLLGDSWFDLPSTIKPQLAKKLPSIYWANSGTGGDTAGDLVNRFDVDVTTYKPDTVWILAGTNDYWQGVTTSEYKNNIQTLINKSKAIGAKVIIIDSGVGEETVMGSTGLNNKAQSKEYVDAVIELY